MSADREVTSNEDLSALLRLIFEEATAQLPDLAPILSTAIEQHNANVARINELEQGLALKLYRLPAESIVRMLDESKRWQRLHMAANFRQWVLKNVGTQQGEST